jgi:hypothetical protein
MASPGSDCQSGRRSTRASTASKHTTRASQRGVCEIGPGLIRNREASIACHLDSVNYPQTQRNRMPPILARVNFHAEIHPGLPAHPTDSPPIPGSEQSSHCRQLSRILSGGETCIHPHSGAKAATRKILVVVTEKNISRAKQSDPWLSMRAYEKVGV